MNNADYELEELLAGITPENRHPEGDFAIPQGLELLCGLCPMFSAIRN
jgi:hypothetical protein